ncbi:helix-turn-helix domain-containing protein [Nocardia wallacei]|uniref:helix-turn-helix domain-containing protein n=1 Tax=Nocardia wallacei TaxID=480035 RepID=UPI0024544E75|nr:helix-turn-helix transcriptional regulator [Nocardia wallacei]
MINHEPDHIPPVVWEHHRMRQALAGRDLKKVFELLQEAGISQRKAARHAGLNDSDLYRILNKGRVVTSVNTLTRVADGLGIPRGYLGLAYDDSTDWILRLVPPTGSGEEAETGEVRDLLAYASTVATGTSGGDGGWGSAPMHGLVPERVREAHIDSLDEFTAAMRRMDYQFGGGACRDPIATQVHHAEQLLHAEHSEALGRRLRASVADMHNLAGWTCFDIGLFTAARRHFRRALTLARQAEDHSLLSNILYRAGRLHLHRNMPAIALKFFQLGQLTAQDSGCTLTVAMLTANEGWARAVLGQTSQMHHALRRAEDEFASADHDIAAQWVRFFGDADLHAILGVALTSHPAANAVELDEGIRRINTAIALRDKDMARSRVFELSALATAHLRNGDRDEGLHTGTNAIAAAGDVRSVRTIDRLTPLREAAARRRGDADLQHLAHAIDRLKAHT